MKDFKRKTDLIGFDIETNQWYNYTKLLNRTAANQCISSLVV